MSIYDEMQTIAKEILTDPEFKQGVISYIAMTPGAGPVDDPGNPIETTYELPGAVARGVQFRYVSEGLAVSSDKQVTMPVDSRFIPNGTGFMLIDGERYKIVQVMNKPAAGTPVVHILIVRK